MVVVADASVVVGAIVVAVATVVDVSIGKVVVTAGTTGATVVVVVVTAVVVVEVVVVVVGRVAIQYRSYMSRAKDWYDLARIA